VRASFFESAVSEAGKPRDDAETGHDRTHTRELLNGKIQGYILSR
jgi:hypothetical protein